MAIVLETQRLTFRDHEPADMERYCAMQADPEVRRYVGGRPLSRAEAEARFRNGLQPSPPSRLSLCATVYKPDACYIGYCGLYPHFGGDDEPVPGEACISFYLARVYWGRGLATEAGLAFLHLGLGELGLDRIVTLVDVRHEASIRVLGKLGLVLTGSETGATRTFGRYAITREQWAAVRRLPDE